MANRLTVTGRLARTTSSPARTRAYARLPSTLMALTPGGRCSIGPVNCAAAATIASWPMPAGRDIGHRFALGVVGRRGQPEPDGGVVVLVVQGEMSEQPGGPADADQQDAGRHRIEGAGVAYPAGAGQPAHPGDDVMRREPGGLSTTTTPPRCGGDTTSAPRRCGASEPLGTTPPTWARPDKGRRHRRAPRATPPHVRPRQHREPWPATRRCGARCRAHRRARRSASA